jgi:hypothetical protein
MVLWQLRCVLSFIFLLLSKPCMHLFDSSATSPTNGLAQGHTFTLRNPGECGTARVLQLITRHEVVPAHQGTRVPSGRTIAGVKAVRGIMYANHFDSVTLHFVGI